MSEPYPDQIQIMLTERCNLRCVHCAVPEEDSPADHELTTDVWRRFIARAAGEGVRSAVLSGGEALLRKDCIELLVHAHRSGFAHTTIVTNLAVMSARILDELVEAQERFEDFCLQVSIDGASEATHDWMRGRGQFRALLANATQLRGRGGRITGVNTVFHQANHHEADAVAALAAELGASNWRLFPVAAIGRGRGIQLKQLPAEAWDGLLDRLPEFRSRHSLDVVSMGPVLRSVGADERSPNPLSTDTRRIIVGPDGDMFTCPPLRQASLGNVTDLVDTESWRAACERTRAAIEAHCASCQYLLLCVGVHPEVPFRTALDLEFGEPARLLQSQPL